MLGLNDLSSMRYTGSLAVGVETTDTTPATYRIKVGDPSHMFVSSNVVNQSTLELPGHDVQDGKLVDGLTYTIKNVTPKPGTRGASYTININQYIGTGSQLLHVVYEQDCITVTYSEYHDEWFVMTSHDAW